MLRTRRSPMMLSKWLQHRSITMFRPSFWVVLRGSLWLVGYVETKIRADATSLSLLSLGLCSAWFVLFFGPFFYEPIVRIYLKSKYGMDHVRSELSWLSFFFFSMCCLLLYAHLNPDVLEGAGTSAT